MLARLFISCVLFLLCGCGSNSSNYEIGVDPSWAPLDFHKRQSNVMGFSSELLQTISLEGKIPLSLLQVNWDVLFEGLKTHKYQAILSSMYPYNFNSELYSFSEAFLETGPVLVLPIQAHEKSLDELQEKTIGALQGTPEILLLETYPTILIRPYETIPEVLNDLASGKIGGAILPSLPAGAYINDLYHEKLKIVGKPLNDFGLRLITLKDKAPDLVRTFNKTLKHLKKNGDYEKLLIKWQLAYLNSKPVKAT